MRNNSSFEEARSAPRKVILLGPAYPYRGGIATIIETLARVFQSRGAEVEVFTFRVQYPRLLFPGRSQFRDGVAPEGLRVLRCVNTVNPLNWWRVGRRIARERPDMVVLKYWTPFMAPCFGTITRVARFLAARRGRGSGNGSTKTPKFVVQLDNVVPHERRWFDGLLTRYFLGAMDGFVYMSAEVGRDLEQFEPAVSRAGAFGDVPVKRKPRVYSPHPIFDHFGERVSRDEACAALGLDPTVKYAMFFGLVREYKGLDLLLDAWAQVKAGEVSGGNPEAGSGDDREGVCKKLLVVGEFYDDVAKYRAQIEALGLQDDVVIRDRFVPDDCVRLWFSVAELLVLPYRTATQSGVTQIAYHFEVPMVVTDAGGLPEIVPDGTVGYVAAPEARSIAAAIGKFFASAPADGGVGTDVNSVVETLSNAERLRANFAVEKRRFSWDAAADALLSVAGKG